MVLFCRPSYVVPSSVAQGIKIVHPMFRGYTQQVRVARMRKVGKCRDGQSRGFGQKKDGSVTYLH